MRTPPLHRRRERSAALVLTLLVVSLLSIILVAFLQNMTLSRTTSKSYGDIRRADMAAEAGLETAAAQIVYAIGTNQAFVTGLTNYPSTNFPVTVIGQRDLTDASQMMPLVSGPSSLWTGFGRSGWEQSFAAYAAARTNADPALSVDVNTAHQYIQATNSANLYRAAWVVMTNFVGTKTNYSRFAYVVLDDTARVNPSLMTGAGTGYSDPTNWYSGPGDIALTNTGASLLTPGQMSQLLAATNTFTASDATLGQLFPSRTAYEAVKHFFTVRTNASFDVIPGWLPDGGRPKYNINDLATNPLYGATAMDRATNMAAIISRNLTNFYLRDPALKATDSTLYVKRLAANVVDYINPDGAFATTDYVTNSTGISPQGAGVYPVEIAEQIYAPTGGQGTPPHSKASVKTQFWLSVWNPYTTPITISSASLRVSSRPNYTFGSAIVTPMPDYDQPMNYDSATGGVVGPNEYVVLGFPAVTTQMNVSPTIVVTGPAAATTGNLPFQQFSLTINGQTVAQTQGTATGGGMEYDGGTISAAPNYVWDVHYLSTSSVTPAAPNNGTQVGDPRFQSYYNTVWPGYTSTYAGTATSTSFSFWKGRPNSLGGGKMWQPISTWVNRDNIARNTAAMGSVPATAATTPDMVASTYNAAVDAPAAPEVIRNGPMVSIGELGHVFDPAYADDNLTAANGTSSGLFDNYTSSYQNGGARSLRIGRPEATGSGGAFSWNTAGERGIELLNLFTVNSTNLVTGGALGRINPNTASSDVLAAVLSGIQVDSDTGMGGTRTLANVGNLAAQVISNRPYSSLSDLYKVMPAFDTVTNYSPNFTANSAGYLNVFNRVHQEAFGKWVQHLTVQSRSYRVYVIGQVLDGYQKPHSSVALEAGIYLQYNPTTAGYQPVFQYARFLK